jgi:hypothetical protein
MRGAAVSGTGALGHPNGRRDIVQMRWKTSEPRTLTGRPSGPAYVATHLVTTVVGLMKRPVPTVVIRQSGVQFLEVWNTTIGL